MKQKLLNLTGMAVAAPESFEIVQPTSEDVAHIESLFDGLDNLDAESLLDRCEEIAEQAEKWLVNAQMLKPDDEHPDLEWEVLLAVSAYVAPALDAALIGRKGYGINPYHLVGSQIRLSTYIGLQEWFVEKLK